MAIEGLYFSDWRTAPLDGSVLAIRDNNKWDSAVGSGADNNGFIMAAPAGFPTHNIFRVLSQSGARDGYIAPVINTLGEIPNPGVRNYRWYHAFYEPPMADTGSHPVQDGGSVSQSNWYFSTTNSGANLNPGEWGIDYFFGGFSSTDFNRHRFTLGAQEGTFIALAKETVYRHEVQVVRISATHFRFHVRIHDAAGVLLYDDDDFHSRNGAISLTAQNAAGGFPFNFVANTSIFLVGHNGFGVGTTGPEDYPLHTSDQAGIGISAVLAENEFIGAYPIIIGEEGAPVSVGGGLGLLKRKRRRSRVVRYRR